MIQEIITYIIGIIVAIIVGRWLFNIVKGDNKGSCTTCDGCSHKDNCNNPK